MFNSDIVKGLKISNTQNEIKCIQHADTCSMFSVKDIESLEHVFKELLNFLHLQQIEFIKKGMYPLRVLKHTMGGETTQKGIKSNFEKIKWLGIYKGHNKTANDKRNCLCKHQEFQKKKNI